MNHIYLKACKIGKCYIALLIDIIIILVSCYISAPIVIIFIPFLNMVHVHYIEYGIVSFPICFIISTFTCIMLSLLISAYYQVCSSPFEQLALKKRLKFLVYFFLPCIIAVFHFSHSDEDMNYRARAIILLISCLILCSVQLLLPSKKSAGTEYMIRKSRLASLIRRFIACLIDTIIFLILLCICIFISIFLVLFFIAIVATFFELTNNYDDDNIKYTLFFIIIVPILFLSRFSHYYYICFPASFRQATLGQRLVGIYTISLSQNKVDSCLALKRAVGFYLPFVIGYMLILIKILIPFINSIILSVILLIFYAVWYLVLPILSSKNQMMYDMLLKTVVVRGKIRKG